MGPTGFHPFSSFYEAKFTIMDIFPRGICRFLINLTKKGFILSVKGELIPSDFRHFTLFIPISRRWERPFSFSFFFFFPCLGGPMWKLAGPEGKGWAPRVNSSIRPILIVVLKWVVKEPFNSVRGRPPSPLLSWIDMGARPVLYSLELIWAPLFSQFDHEILSLYCPFYRIHFIFRRLLPPKE